MANIDFDRLKANLDSIDGVANALGLTVTPITTRISLLLDKIKNAPDPAAVAALADEAQGELSKLGQLQTALTDLGKPDQSAAIPVITSAATASGQVGAAFTFQVEATNAPTSFKASGLPDGLSIDSTTGAISGSPTTEGASSASVTATNANGDSVPQTLVITIAASAAP